jgi:hypothetical protein
MTTTRLVSTVIRVVFFKAFLPIPLADKRMTPLLPRPVLRIRIPDANKLLWAALEGKGVSGSKSFARAQFFINSLSMGF